MKHCEHTYPADDGSGGLAGSWTKNADSEEIACAKCDKSYSEFDQEQQRLRKAYHEQLRRQSCPGCGEEPFQS